MYVVSFAYPTKKIYMYIYSKLYTMYIYIYISIFNIEWTSWYYNFQPQQRAWSVVSYNHIYSPFPCIQEDKKTASNQDLLHLRKGRQGQTHVESSPTSVMFWRSGEDTMRTLENAKGILPELGCTKHWGKCKRYHLIRENMLEKWWIHLWSDIISMHFLSQGILVAV